MEGFGQMRGASMAWRAALAVGLMVGFYVLAFAIAGGLLFLCYAMVVWGERVQLQVLFFSVVGAGAILWSIFPRIDRFVPPGPELKREDHPRLFAEIESVSRAVGQEMPANVYLVPDVNAWVSQRGGVMGVGSKRVMGLGLALMRVLTVSEFRAVLAHEFGHYYGGDTKLGPWVYKTHGAIGRTVTMLDGRFLQKPFLWYGTMFLRVSHAVSRRQELTADRLAATVAGKDALVKGLIKTHGAGMAFEPFWQTEVVPVLSSGFRVPLAEGFGRFMSSASITEAMKKAIHEEMREGQLNPYDTHPPLKQRIAAVQDMPERGKENSRPATVLLENVKEQEQWLLASLAGIEAVRQLTASRWEDVGMQVWLPLWRKVVKEHVAVLRGLVSENLPRQVVPAMRNEETLNTEKMQTMLQAISVSLVVAMVEAGGVLNCMVGSEVSVERGGLKVEPFRVLQRLADDELRDAEWRSQCEVLGIARVDLGTVGGSD